MLECRIHNFPLNYKTTKFIHILPTYGGGPNDDFLLMSVWSLIKNVFSKYHMQNTGIHIQQDKINNTNYIEDVCNFYGLVCSFTADTISNTGVLILNVTDNLHIF